jgi:hypothetical protein
VLSTLDVDVSRLIGKLKDLGFSYRDLARILGTDHTSVYYWHVGRWRPRDADRVVRVLIGLLEDNSFRSFSDGEFSLNHNGPPNNFSSSRDDDRWKIKMVLHKIVFYGQLLELSENLIDNAALIVRQNSDVSFGSYKDYNYVAVAAILVSCLSYDTRLAKGIMTRIKQLRLFTWEEYNKIQGYFERFSNFVFRSVFLDS